MERKGGYMAREIKRWITVNGVHVPIFEGQSTKEAVNNFIDKTSKGKVDKSTKFKDARKDNIDNNEKTKQEQINKNEEQKKQLSEMTKDERRAELAKQDHKGNVETLNKMISDAKNPQDIEKAFKNLQQAKLAVKYDKTLSSQERTRLSKELSTAQDNWLKKQVEVDNALYDANSKKNDEELATAKFDRAIEKARGGDLSVRNEYMDKLNAINAKIGSGRGSAKLVEEASQLREKINKINNAYRESDKYKKEHADTGSGKEIDKEKAEAIKEAYEKQISNKGTTYEVMEKDGKYVVVGGNNNGRDDPGSWHSKREDRLDRGYKPLPDSDYEKWRKDNDVSKTGSGVEVDKARYERAAKKQNNLQEEYERKYSKEYNKYGDPDPNYWGKDKSESAIKDYNEVINASEERDREYKNYTKNLKYSDPHNNPYSKDAKVSSVLDRITRDETFTKDREKFNESIYEDYKDTYKFSDNDSYEDIFHKMLDDGDAVEDAYGSTDWIKGYRDYKSAHSNVSKTSTSYGSGDDKFKQDLKNLTIENLRAVHDNHSKALVNVKTPEQKEWWDRTAKAIMDEEKRRNNDVSKTGSGKAVDSERTSKKVSNSYQEGTYKVTENKDGSEFVVRDGNGRIIGRAPTSKEATHIISQHKEAKVKIKGLNSQIIRLQDEIKKYRAEVRNTDNNYIRQNNLSDAQHKLRELFEQLKKWEKFLE